jgi:hypothetical protein
MNWMTQTVGKIPSSAALILYSLATGSVTNGPAGPDSVIARIMTTHARHSASQTMATSANSRRVMRPLYHLHACAQGIEAGGWMRCDSGDAPPSMGQDRGGWVRYGFGLPMQESRTLDSARAGRRRPAIRRLTLWLMIIVVIVILIAVVVPVYRD